MISITVLMRRDRRRCWEEHEGTATLRSGPVLRWEEHKGTATLRSGPVLRWGEHEGNATLRSGPVLRWEEHKGTATLRSGPVLRWGEHKGTATLRSGPVLRPVPSEEPASRHSDAVAVDPYSNHGYKSLWNWMEGSLRDGGVGGVGAL